MSRVTMEHIVNYVEDWNELNSHIVTLEYRAFNGYHYIYNKETGEQLAYGATKAQLLENIRFFSKGMWYGTQY